VPVGTGDYMKLIILNRGSRAARSLDLGGANLLAGGGLVAGVLSLTIALGYTLGGNLGNNVVVADDLLAMHADLEGQRETLTGLQSAAEEQINALALRMGELNANVIRLNALGSRLTGIADLEAGEFDFQNPPAMGGPVSQLDAEQQTSQLPELLANFTELEDTLDGQQQQLVTLENLLMDRKLRDRVNPKGRPVRKGWISSFFGKRTDPMTGKGSWHKGVDFAGKHGNDVVAVGDGVVSWSGDRYGYGNLVEIKHGNGHLTRYAHNQENLVAVGDKVEQGQTIALMGSTGRSTGPHVHFEVWRNGQPVDPAKYISSH
jgi:murein DD-endopeptidase MepM/ murein hydrolase activator NlpD